MGLRNTKAAFWATPIRARAWGDIIAHYDAVEDGVMRPMARFVERIRDAYDGQLFVATSMHTLLVSPAPVWDMNHDTLTVEQFGDEIHFVLRSMTGREPTWKRHTPADPDAAFGRFEHFVRQHGWIVRYGEG